MIPGLSHNAQWVLASTLILGMAAGIVGCLAYWKRQSLMSDALSHAALPGVIIGFVLAGSKNMPIMITGAAASALLGALMIEWIRSSSRVKEDAAMGMILSVFFGLGIMLLTWVNRMPGGNQSGLDTFIFGQAASMVRQDVLLMSIVALFIILVTLVGYKEWKLYLFDPSFATGLGLSRPIMGGIYTLLLVVVIVIGIQAVGVILMAALLIMPGVSARYWTHSFGWMMMLSALFGGLSGVTGTWISTLGKGWPTGPFIVIFAAVLFVISLIFGLRKGLLIIAVQQRLQRKQSEASSVSSPNAVQRGGCG